MWLGLILIALNIIVNIGQFKSVIFAGSATTTAMANSQNTPTANLV
jgi:hypothetical protein